MYKILNNILEMDDYSLQRLSKSSKLPSEYQQVGYIESTGTQYIDTGIIPISSTRIDIDFAYVGLASSFSWIPIFGARSVVNNVQEQYAVFINKINLKLTINYGFNDVADNSNVYIEANKKYNVKNNQGSFYINDILESSISVSNTLSNNTIYPVYLFDLCNYGGRLNRGTKMKLYSCKFYDGDTLMRNYIPCYRKSDNEIGLYDTVNNVFYTNQGTGEFIAGGYLPSEYQQVEYIESTGTQYIDTGIKLNQDSKIITEIQLTNDGSPNAIFGSRTSATENNFECVSSSSSSIGIRIDFQNYETNRLTTEFNNEKNYILISKTLMQIGESTKRYISYTDFETPSNCYIFYVSGENIYGQKAQMRLYNFKIYQNDVLIKDFIPCYKKINNEIGLYDLVSNTFFTNAGTGKFIHGSISLARSTPVGVKGVEDRANDLSFTDFNNWESEQYDINENKDIEETEQIKSPNILSDTYTSITADTEVQPNQVDFIPKAIDENKASEPTVEQLVGKEVE